MVVLPDQFANDPLPGSATYAEEKDPSIIEQIKLRVAETSKSFLIDMWLARQTPEKVLPIIHKVLDAAKDEFADAVANGGGVYSVGYCFGGRVSCFDSYLMMVDYYSNLSICINCELLPLAPTKRGWLVVPLITIQRSPNTR